MIFDLNTDEVRFILESLQHSRKNVHSYPHANYDIGKEIIEKYDNLYFELVNKLKAGK